MLLNGKSSELPGEAPAGGWSCGWQNSCETLGPASGKFTIAGTCGFSNGAACPQATAGSTSAVTATSQAVRQAVERMGGGPILGAIETRCWVE